MLLDVALPLCRCQAVVVVRFLLRRSVVLAGIHATCQLVGLLRTHPLRRSRAGAASSTWAVVVPHLRAALSSCMGLRTLIMVPAGALLHNDQEVEDINPIPDLPFDEVPEDQVSKSLAYRLFSYECHWLQCHIYVRFIHLLVHMKFSEDNVLAHLNEQALVLV